MTCQAESLEINFKVKTILLIYNYYMLIICFAFQKNVSIDTNFIVLFVNKAYNQHIIQVGEECIWAGTIKKPGNLFILLKKRFKITFLN